jgi:hypothetical protein
MKLEIAVLSVVTIINIPAASRGRFKLNLIVGQAVPSKLSGKPNDMKAIYMTINRIVPAKCPSKIVCKHIRLYHLPENKHRPIVHCL